MKNFNIIPEKEIKISNEVGNIVFKNDTTFNDNAAFNVAKYCL
jgi:hypothetical protein